MGDCMKLLEEAREYVAEGSADMVHYMEQAKYLKDQASLLARIDALLKGGGWEPMVSAQLDGTEIKLLIRHNDYWTALKVNGKKVADREYQRVCRGKWIDHNGGGWCWYGIAGVQVGWQPLQPQPRPGRGCDCQ